jgi:hypothetical protein
MAAAVGIWLGLSGRPHCPAGPMVTRHEYGAEHGGDWCGGAAQPVPAAGAVAPSAYPLP